MFASVAYIGNMIVCFTEEHVPTWSVQCMDPKGASNIVYRVFSCSARLMRRYLKEFAENYKKEKKKVNIILDEFCRCFNLTGIKSNKIY